MIFYILKLMTHRAVRKKSKKNTNFGKNKILIHKEKLWMNPKPPRKVSSLIIKARKGEILKWKLSLKEK
jgi:hypothetical protein